MSYGVLSTKEELERLQKQEEKASLTLFEIKEAIKVVTKDVTKQNLTALLNKFDGQVIVLDNGDKNGGGFVDPEPNQLVGRVNLQKGCLEQVMAIVHDSIVLSYGESKIDLSKVHAVWSPSDDLLKVYNTFYSNAWWWVGKDLLIDSDNPTNPNQKIN